MNTKLSLILIALLVPLLCAGQQLQGGWLLNYNFSRHLPLTFDISKSSALIVGDGHFIYKFDASGKLVLKTEVPNTNYESAIFTDLKLDKESDNICTFALSGHQVTFDILNKKVLADLKIYGNTAKKDANGVYYSLCQHFSEKKNVVENKLKVIEKNGKSYDYATTIDLGADNFQIINNNIVLYVQNEQCVYFLPVVGRNYGRITKIKTDMPDDKPVKMLGMVANKYLFQYFDYKKKKDVLNIYDEKMQLAKQVALEFNAAELSNLYRIQDNGDWLTEFPSGNIYNFSNGGIYFLRTTKKGTFIYKLSSLIKI
jgi:hypothetical protein